MGRIQGDGETPSIQDKKLYEAEYKQAADLFQRSLNEYNKSDNMYQKEEFKKVMKEAMQILNDAAAELKRKDLNNQNDKIQHDFDTFRSDDTQASALQADLTKAKRIV